MALAPMLPVMANSPICRALGPRTLRPTLSMVRDDAWDYQFRHPPEFDALCRFAYRRGTAPVESIAGSTSSPPGGRLFLLRDDRSHHDAHNRSLWRARGLMRLVRSSSLGSKIELLQAPSRDWWHGLATTSSHVHNHANCLRRAVD